MLNIENVSKTFGGRQILNGLTLSICSGKVIGIFGQSGSGKTTLLKTVLGLLEADEGQISLNGVAYSGFSKGKKETFRLANFSYIPPEANLLSALSVKENILFPLELQKISFDAKRFEEIIKELELSDLLNENCESLSSGEKQRVAVARAVMLDKAAIIADEPTSHLDHELALKTMRILKKEAQESGKMILCACHDREILSQFDEVYFMNNGGVVR